MTRLTKRYPNGNITLDAEQFDIDQTVLDTEINNSEPIAAAVKRLAEFEDAEEKGLIIRKTAKPKEVSNGDFRCSACAALLKPRGQGHKPTYCHGCGKKVDWSDYPDLECACGG